MYTKIRANETNGWYSKRIDSMCARGKDDWMQQLQLSGDLLERRSFGVWPHPQSEDVPCCSDNIQVETRDMVCEGKICPWLHRQVKMSCHLLKSHRTDT